MRKNLFIFVILTFHFSAFAQIDTIEWAAKGVWIKTYVLGERCCSENYIVWGLFAQYDVRNPHTNETDEYILIKENEDTFLQNLPNLYIKAVDFDISEKKILVDDFQKNVPEIEIALIKRFGNLDNVYFFDDYEGGDLTNDWVYVLPISLSKISLIDLKTSRVIEKIKLEPK